jgi:uncharacterized protein YjbJ (UPF0337 family)
MASRKNKADDGATFASGSTGGEGLMDQARGSAEEVMGKAREKAGEVAGQAQEKAKSQLSMGKDRVAESMEGVAQALRSSTSGLEDQQMGFVGDYMNRAADKVTEISDHLRQRDVNELIHETEDFARREPTIFLAGAFALGLIAARFLKSSGSNMQSGGGQRWSGNAGYSEDYDAAPYGGYDRNAGASFNEGGMAGLSGASGMGSPSFGGSGTMPGSGVMGDGPFATGTAGEPGGQA